MPQLQSLEDTKNWLSGLYGEEGIIYRDIQGQVVDKSDPVKFHRVMGFKHAKYSPHSERSQKRWNEEGPYVWTVLLEEKLEWGPSYHIVTIYDGTHNDMVRAFITSGFFSEEQAWEAFASHEFRMR